MFSSHVVHCTFPVVGVAVRPDDRVGRAESAEPPEAVIFHDGEVRVFNGSPAKSIEIDAVGQRLGSKVSTSPLNGVSCAAYEPTTGQILFSINRTAVAGLDNTNNVSLIAGNLYTKRSGGGDGHGDAARFLQINGLAPDGLGNVYISDTDCIRKLDVATCQVTTLPGSSPGSQSSTWVGLACDGSTNVLLAATDRAVCVVDTTNSDAELPNCGGGQATGAAAGDLTARSAAVRLVAGDWTTTGSLTDGPGGTARFSRITSILAGSGGRLFILDHGALRVLSAKNFVSTALTGLATGTPACLAVLPQGELLAGATGNPAVQVIRGPGLAPSSPILAGHGTCAPPRQLQPSPATAQLRKALLANPSASDRNIGVTGRGGDVAGHSVFIIVRVGDQSFGAHRAVLSAHSDYFKQLLAPGGGFVESGAAEVSLMDVDAEAFSWLLAYMYTGELYMPYELLRAGNILTDRLLMSPECVAVLQEWLMGAVSPESVVSDLVWAERHNLGALVPRLRAYLLRHRKKVVMASVDELVLCFPELAISLMRELAAAM